MQLASDLAASMAQDYTRFSKRALLVLILERQAHMQTDITALQQTVAQQTATLAAFQPVLQASLDLSQSAVAKLDELFVIVQGLQPTQASIDELTAAVSAARDQLAGDIASVNEKNAVLQAELTKVSTTPTS